MTGRVKLVIWLLLKFKPPKQIKFEQVDKYLLTVNLPRFGFCLPARIFSAVDLPIPLVPTSPRTSPGLGIGNLIKHNQN